MRYFFCCNKQLEKKDTPLEPGKSRHKLTLADQQVQLGELKTEKDNIKKLAVELQED